MLSTNNPSISAKYKLYRNKITHLKESLKQNYYRSKFDNCRNDVKKTWKVINEIISTKTKKSKIGAETYNTDLTDQTHCEELNKHFPKLAKIFPSKLTLPLQLSMTFSLSLSPICVHSHQPVLMKSGK